MTSHALACQHVSLELVTLPSFTHHLSRITSAFGASGNVLNEISFTSEAGNRHMVCIFTNTAFTL
jgi:hypothetical protein